MLAEGTLPRKSALSPIGQHWSVADRTRSPRNPTFAANRSNARRITPGVVLVAEDISYLLSMPDYKGPEGPIWLGGCLTRIGPYIFALSPFN